MARKRAPAEPPRAPPAGQAGEAPAGSPKALRRQAEARLMRGGAACPEEVGALTPEQTRHLLHELQVHQIELEMQNEELRDAHVALDIERERYFDLYDLAPVGYCTVSEEGLVTKANLTAASLLGTTRRELLGQRWARFIHRDDADRYYLHRKLLLGTAEPQSCEFRMVRADGAPFWGQWTATVSPDAHGGQELRAVVSDITARKRAESEHLQAGIALRESKEAADKANRAKSDFLSSMSHELRTPLNSILGFAQLIAAGTPPPGPSQKRNVDYILAAGWYLLGLVDEILDLAVIESGKLSLSMQAVPLDEVMRECRAMVEQQADAHGIRLALPVAGTPCHVDADRKRLTQALCNLLSNAIKYNRPDGAVCVDWAPAGAGRVRISIRDTGQGLAPDQLAQLFQPFNRLGSESGPEQGTGIGLVVCKRVVEMMGGRIGVESEVGKGSLFWIELGLATRPPPAASPPPVRLAPACPADGASPRTLLCVEGDPANLALVEAIVAGRPDLRLLKATDGETGMAIARAALPDAILMDIHLPGVSGIQAMASLARDPATAHIPVIALSANAIASDVERGLAAGFFRYLTKPIRIAEFMQTLDAALDFSASQANRTHTKDRP